MTTPTAKAMPFAEQEGGHGKPAISIAGNQQ